MLQVEQVSKIYPPASGLLRAIVRTAASSPVTALHHIDFDVAPGQITALVGPNGAGKSTLLRICAALLQPTSGRVRFDGADLTADARGLGARMGLLLADDRALYWRLTGRENLEFFGVIAGLTRADAARRADELLIRFDLHERDRRVFGYSSGMRIRLGLARALMHRPDLLILDEPTRSLDPIASQEFLDELRTLAAQGTAIVLSNHRLEEVAACADRVLVLVDGRQVAWAGADELGRPSSLRQTLLDLLRDESAVEGGSVGG